MWRLVPLLAVLGFLEVLVPWPDVAAFVLTNAHSADQRAVTPRTAAAPIELRHDRPQLLVQARDAFQ